MNTMNWKMEGGWEHGSLRNEENQLEFGRPIMSMMPENSCMEVDIETDCMTLVGRTIRCAKVVEKRF